MSKEVIIDDKAPMNWHYCAKHDIGDDVLHCNDCCVVIKNKYFFDKFAPKPKVPKTAKEKREQKRYFVELIANEITDSLRDEYPICMDYDDNTRLWLDKARKIAERTYPYLKDQVL
jgi:hypothetical protein